ncbi:unnamed protein product, partial [Urochloa humidicola]
AWILSLVPLLAHHIDEEHLLKFFLLEMIERPRETMSQTPEAEETQQ